MALYERGEREKHQIPKVYGSREKCANCAAKPVYLANEYPEPDRPIQSYVCEECLREKRRQHRDDKLVKLGFSTL
jgi:hypothetical protein